MRHSRCLFALTAVTLAGCGGKAPDTRDLLVPVPTLNDRALLNCTYDRIATVEVERTGTVINPQREIPRALGLKARAQGADAIVDLKMGTIVPAIPGGSTNGRRANGVRASAVAIRFTSPKCPWNRRAR
jgi:hypothetical protein